MIQAQTPTTLILRLEIIWWILTAMLIMGVLLPIRPHWNTYPFLWSNVIFILVFVTLTRYTFLLTYTFIANRERLKVFLFFLCIPLVFLLVQELNRFQLYLDYNGLEAVLGFSSEYMNNNLINYIYNEMLLFSVGSIVSGIIFPLRLLLSVWRNRNLGTA